MYSQSQCEAARKLTGSALSDERINNEAANLSPKEKEQASGMINRMLLINGAPLSECFKLMEKDFQIS